MKIEVVPFQPRHLDMFKPGYWDHEINSWAFRETVLRQAGNGLTAILDGKVQGCIFITQPVYGVSQIHMFGSDEAREKHWLWLGTTFLRAIHKEFVLQNLGIDLVRIVVHEGYWKSRKWVERLGFTAVAQKDGLIEYERETDWEPYFAMLEARDAA